MRKTLAVLLMLSVAAHMLLFETAARADDAPLQDDAEELFSPEQLDNLVAPIALYPDPLLAQVVVAATFPDQIDEAARFLRAGADPRAIDDQPWDVSVKAVAHYPTVLYMMADGLDWTTSLGQAYVYQSTDVMASVQRLRAQARAAGYLETTPQMEVVDEGGYIALWPARPRALYVPIYDPALVFHHHGGYGVGPVISFGLGFTIGAWLNHDFDWHRHRIYYHGWKARKGWVHRYRRHVHFTDAYVNKRYNRVRINRSVVNRRVHYRTLNRYNAVHRGVHYNDVRARRHRVDTRGRPRGHGARGHRRDVHNKVIRRNFDPNDPRINANRGRRFEHRPGRRGSTRDVRPMPRRHQRSPQADRPVRRHQRRQFEHRSGHHEPAKKVHPMPRRHQRSPQADRPVRRHQRRKMQRRDNSVFHGNRTGIDPRAARQRGRASRHQAKRSKPATESPAQRKRSPSRRRGNAPAAQDDRGSNAPSHGSKTPPHRGRHSR